MHGCRRWCVTVSFITMAAGLTGCQTGQLQAERDSLWRQNQQLQSDLSKALADRDAATQQRNAAASQLQALRGQVGQYQSQLEAERARAAAANAAARTGFDDIAGVETERTADRITVRVPGDVLFESGKIDLRPTSQRTLAQIAAIIQRDYASKTIRIEGYTDTDPIRRSQWKDNLELSLQRAASVHRFLQSQGVGAQRMYAAGFGQTRLRETKTKSRRVEIVVVLDDQIADAR